MDNIHHASIAVLHSIQLWNNILSSDHELGLCVRSRSTTRFSQFVIEEHDDDQWLSMFRITKASIFELSDQLWPLIQKQNTKYALAIPVVVRVACTLEPNISFEFVPIPRPHPSAATYAHPQHDMCPPMPTHAIQIAPMYSKNVTLSIISHPCPPMNNNISPMPTQNPWAWVGMDIGAQCRAMMYTPKVSTRCQYAIMFQIFSYWHLNHFECSTCNKREQT